MVLVLYQEAQGWWRWEVDDRERPNGAKAGTGILMGGAACRPV